MARTQESRLARVAERQFGVAGTAQAQELGIERRAVWRLVESGRWERALPRVIRLIGSGSSFEQGVMAACLWGGPLAVASHRSAARLWGLDGDWGDVAEVTVPYALRNERCEGPIVHRSRRIDDRDRTQVGVIPVTRVERTLVDLAAILSRNDLEVALDSAIRRERTSPERLWRRMEALAGRRGLRDLRRLLELQQPEASHSRWETKLLQLIRDGGLPEPVRQHRVWDGSKWRRLDLAYPDLLIGLEYDSYRWHFGRQPWEKDHTRNADLVALAWRMLPVTMDDLDITPKRTLERIRSLRELAARHRS